MDMKSKNILLVDDDEELCEEIAGILTEEGYSVTTAFEGVQGKKLIEHNRYDLVLLDIKMPGINGLEILKYAKDTKVPAKFIIITGGIDTDIGSPAIKISGLEHDQEIAKRAEAIIAKPFDVVVLLEKIHQLIGS